jgi:hypothetical protein
MRWLYLAALTILAAITLALCIAGDAAIHHP